MGKLSGFLEYERSLNPSVAPKERIKNYDEFHTRLPEAERRKQGARCMDCGVPFCQSGVDFGGACSGCPLHNLIPEWNDMVYRGSVTHALERLLKGNNFPEFTGRVCPALCEAACTCALHGDAVTVRDNELGIIESAFEQGLMKPRIPPIRTGRKVAIIGSGPSGLAAADQLNRRGHSVTVYERDDRIGGLLMYGIPNMKLEKGVVSRRAELMKREGVEFVTGADVGNNVKADEILQNYDAVLLACGAKNPRDLKVPGRDAKGVYFAVDFLTSTTKALLSGGLKEGNHISAKGKKVVIIGGGDTGNDCVGTSIRHGCTSVVQVEMMPKMPDERAEENPWPQWPRVCKTDYGQEEAIAVFGGDPRVYETTVKELIKGADGELKAVRLVKLAFKKDRDGRLTFSEIRGSEYEMEADMLLIAAGFLGCSGYVAESFGVELNERTNVKTDPCGHRTNIEKVFAAGDMRRGQSLVVWAISEGREAAKEIDAYFMGYTNLT